jgi:hypothetical protein
VIAAARDYEASKREAEKPYEEWPVTVRPREEKSEYRRAYRGEMNIQFASTPELLIKLPPPPPGQYTYRVVIEPVKDESDRSWLFGYAPYIEETA